MVFLAISLSAGVKLVKGGDCRYPYTWTPLDGHCTGLSPSARYCDPTTNSADCSANAAVASIHPAGASLEAC